MFHFSSLASIIKHSRIVEPLDQVISNIFYERRGCAFKLASHSNTFQNDFSHREVAMECSCLHSCSWQKAPTLTNTPAYLRAAFTFEEQSQSLHDRLGGEIVECREHLRLGEPAMCFYTQTNSMSEEIK